jgi:hypothetical protein
MHETRGLLGIVSAYSDDDVCRELRRCGEILELAVSRVKELGASDDEIMECQKLIAPVMMSLFLRAAGPSIRRRPELELLFTAGPDGAPS